ncbi:NAD(P)/FAD-dependent oxidoreductase [Thiocapsa sp.]|uniref:NAD(P)/FAD-dependent oxidoreductase n=1 Tax=Thiocapsa sp. TaxID=2024551 RepID=UPI003594345B
MDLKSGYPFWAVKNGLMAAFPPLQTDIKCDVAVIGGGITGALIADELTSHHFDVVVIEQRDVGWGSTAASTALLQYEIDTHLVDLTKRYGEEAAVLAYRGCATAITELHDLAAEVCDVDFAMQQSLYYASRWRDKSSLRDEFVLRTKHGFKADWLDADAVKDRYAVAAPCAILTHLAARIDPYRMAYRLLARVVHRGGQVYDRTEVKSIDATPPGVTLHTTDDMKIRCRHVVMAAGYANQKWLKQPVAKNRSSYSFITDPIEESALGALASTMVWESARPYLYMRSTGDGRLLVGGEDDNVDIPARRDRRVEKKANKLTAQVGRLFPHLALQPAFSWGGTFAETADGLPFFGPHSEYGPSVLFAMAYGGNGITYSMIGADLLRAGIEGRIHPLAELFSFKRIG